MMEIGLAVVSFVFLVLFLKMLQAHFGGKGEDGGKSSNPGKRRRGGGKRRRGENFNPGQSDSSRQGFSSGDKSFDCSWRRSEDILALGVKLHCLRAKRLTKFQRKHLFKNKMLLRWFAQECIEYKVGLPYICWLTLEGRKRSSPRRRSEQPFTDDIEGDEGEDEEADAHFEEPLDSSEMISLVPSSDAVRGDWQARMADFDSDSDSEEDQDCFHGLIFVRAAWVRRPVMGGGALPGQDVSDEEDASRSVPAGGEGLEEALGAILEAEAAVEAAKVKTEEVKTKEKQELQGTPQKHKPLLQFNLKSLLQGQRTFVALPSQTLTPRRAIPKVKEELEMPQTREEATIVDSMAEQQRLERITALQLEMQELMQADPASGGRLGGHPKKPEGSLLRGVDGGDKSNRIQAGQKRLYNTVGAKDLIIAPTGIISHLHGYMLGDAQYVCIRIYC